MAESSYMIAPGETSDTLAMRKKLAMALAQKNLEPPKIEHWAQGLAHLADQAYSGYEIGKINRDEKEESAKGNALLAALFNGAQAPSSVPAAADPSLRPAGVSTPMGDTKIYSNDEPSPLDPVASNQPRGYRNNNPLNIEAGGFTQGQPGFVGSDGRFAKFASLDQGVGAANTLLDTYEKKHGLNTIAGILSRWAPTSDGNNVSAYAANVSKQLGIDPNAPVPPEMRQKLIAAMAQHENGKPMPSMGAPQQMAQAPQAAPAAPGGVNKEALIQMLGNRKTAPMAQAIMQGAISKQFEPTKPTDEMREYDLYRQQGGKDKFVDYKTGLKKAGAIQNSVQIDQKGESEFSKESGKLQAKRFNELADDAPAAKQMLSDVEVLRELGTKIETGKGAEVRAAIGPYAEALGIKVDGLSEIQAYEAVVNRVAPNLRVKGSGAQSDFELKNFMKSLPSIGNTPGGNELSSRVLEGLYQNKMTAAEIGAKALNGEITRPQAEKMIRDLPDPMKEWREFKKQEKAAPAAAPDKSALEAEMRRRGLLK